MELYGFQMYNIIILIIGLSPDNSDQPTNHEKGFKDSKEIKIKQNPNEIKDSKSSRENINQNNEEEGKIIISNLG